MLISVDCKMVCFGRRARGGESLTTEDTEGTEGVMKILMIRIFLGKND